MDWSIAIIVWIVCGIASLLIAQSRNATNPGTWFVVGVLLGPIGILLALVGVKSRPAAIVSGAGAPPSNVADELAKLVALRNAGELTQAEFDQHRSRLMGPSAPIDRASSWQQTAPVQPSSEYATASPGPQPPPAKGSRTAERVVIALIILAVLGGGALVYSRMQVNQILADVASSLPTARPTARATIAPPAPVYAGSGVITFGTDYDPDTLFIDKPVTRFKRTFPEIAWSAELTRGPGALTITWVVASQSASGVEVTLLQEDHNVSSPENDLFANKIDLAFFLDNKAGTYVMRYIESGEVLAEGTFTLVN